MGTGVEGIAETCVAAEGGCKVNSGWLLVVLDAAAS